MVLGCQSIVTPEHQLSDQAGLFERIKGKISISGQPSSFSFDWYHTDDSHRLRFSSFGLVVAEVAAKGSDITIQTGDGQTWNQASAQLWMEVNLGIALPLQSVAFWLSGRPDPGHGQAALRRAVAAAGRAPAVPLPPALRQGRAAADAAGRRPA